MRRHPAFAAFAARCRCLPSRRRAPAAAPHRGCADDGRQSHCGGRGLDALFLCKSRFCLAAFALPGAGLLPVVPLLFSRAGRLDGVSSAAAASLISVLAYGGLLVVPPVIGLIAEQAGLEAALLTALVLCAAVVAGSLLFRQK